MMKMEKDPLDELFTKTDESEVNQTLTKILKPYVQLTKEGELSLLPAFSSLDNRKRMLIVLLAKKAFAIKLKLKELTLPKEIQKITGLTVGTVNPTLRLLFQERLVVNEKGQYFVPNYAIHDIKIMFKTDSVEKGK